jgi:DNA-binding LacI/PurR family transcriptional regulator
MSPDSSESHGQRPVTTHDVANAAGVNQSTVSRALRNDPAVSQGLRDRIRKLADEMGYRPNPFVAAFTAQVRNYRKSPQHATLAFFHPADYGSFDMSVGYWSGAKRRAETVGFRTEDFHLSDVGGSFERMKKIFWTRAICGVLIFPVSDDPKFPETFFDGLAASTVDPSVHHPHLNRAQSNYFQGMQLCLRELTARGYRRPAFCSLLSEVGVIGAEWLGAFTGWLAVQPPSNQIQPYLQTDWDEARFKKWLRKEKPDAIITNDQFFFWWAEDAGAVPPKVAFVALGGIHSRPEVSGVNQNGDLVGAAAVDMIVDQIHRNEYGLSPAAKTVLIEPAWREGTTAPGVSPTPTEAYQTTPKTGPRRRSRPSGLA